MSVYDAFGRQIRDAQSSTVGKRRHPIFFKVGLTAATRLLSGGTPILVQAPDPGTDADTPTTICSYDYTAGKKTVESTLIASANHAGSGLSTATNASQTRKTRETYNASGSLLKSERFDSHVDAAGVFVAAD